MLSWRFEPPLNVTAIDRAAVCVDGCHVFPYSVSATVLLFSRVDLLYVDRHHHCIKKSEWKGSLRVRHMAGCLVYSADVSRTCCYYDDPAELLIAHSLASVSKVVAGLMSIGSGDQSSAERPCAGKDWFALEKCLHAKNVSPR